jgi:hypothetical protein
MNARRLMRLPKPEDDSLPYQAEPLCITANSIARLLLWVKLDRVGRGDTRTNVRFTPCVAKVAKQAL